MNERTEELYLTSSLLFTINSKSTETEGKADTWLRTAMAASGSVTTYQSSTTTTSKSWLSSSTSVSKANRSDEGRKTVHKKPNSLSIPTTKVDIHYIESWASILHLDNLYTQISRLRPFKSTWTIWTPWLPISRRRKWRSSEESTLTWVSSFIVTLTKKD